MERMNKWGSRLDTLVEKRNFQDIDPLVVKAAGGFL